MSINAIKYATSGEIDWDNLEKCWHHGLRSREDTAYKLFRDKKDLTEKDRERLFELLDARSCYNYAMEVVGGRWEKAERKIATGGYVTEFVRDSCGWVKEEENIYRNQFGTKWAYLYALNVIKGRWEEGEERISHEILASLAYAKNVLKGRFRLAEKYISEEKSELKFVRLYNKDHGPMGYPIVPPKQENSFETWFFENTREPGDNCENSMCDWHCYEGCPIRDVYIAELFGERNEDFEKRVMKSKKYADRDKDEGRTDRHLIILRYAANCLKGRLPEKMHNYMLNGALEKNDSATKYCENFPEDLLKARTLGFAPK